MKKILSLILAALMLTSAFLFVSCGNNEAANNDSAADTQKADPDDTQKADDNDTIIVNTNAFFAPFEYYDGDTIVGVDVEIMDKVGEKLGKKVQFDNTEFSVIIDNVAKGEVCDCGAAGITITDARKEKVDFSTPYYTSVQYVIWAEDDDSVETVDDKYVLWDSLAGKKIGVQTDTTGMIFADGEINAQADDPDYGYDGVLYGTDTELVNFDNGQLAADAITGSKQIDVVIIDELPAQFIVDKNAGLKCLPLYYKGGEGEEDTPTEEQYAICVTKGNTELLDAINEVLAEMLVEDDNGQSEVIKLVMKHMGME